MARPDAHGAGDARRGSDHGPASPPVFRAAPSLRLAANALVIVWMSVVAIVLLDTRDASAVPELALASVLLGLALAPAFRVRVAATASGISFSNGYRQRFLPWSGVTGFRVVRSFWGGCVTAVLRSGRRVPLGATAMSVLAPGRSRHLEYMRATLEGARPGEDG